MATDSNLLTLQSDAQERLVGSDRVLAVLVELANFPDGVTLDDMAKRIKATKPTVHRALASLCRAGLASKDGRGRYILGDEFLRMAFSHHESRPDHLRVEPILRILAERFGETAHYAVLDGDSIVYRAKVDPRGESIRLTSTIGGRNPAHATALGKVLLSQKLTTLSEVQLWIGERTLKSTTPNTRINAETLHHEIERVRAFGYGLDEEENEPGVNCIAFPYYFSSPSLASGAISISALKYRTPLSKLLESVEEIRDIISGQA
jgi:DNA-binding IclR family transcriptional regulator